jgi:hypothetical protein
MGRDPTRGAAGRAGRAAKTLARVDAALPTVLDALARAEGPPTLDDVILAVAPSGVSPGIAAKALGRLVADGAVEAALVRQGVRVVRRYAVAK